MKLSHGLLALAVLALAGCSGDSTTTTTTTTATPATTPQPTRTIIMVWDGLRPDSVNATDTPNLYALRQ